MIRRTVESASRNLTLKRRLPTKQGRAPIWVNSAGGLKYLTRRLQDVDPMLLYVSNTFTKDNAVVWDIGANLGLFSVASAANSGSSGRVFALEPDAWLVQILRRTARDQPPKSAPIEVVPIGLAGSVGLRRFAIAERARATNHLEGYGSTMTGGVREWTTIFCVDLDWLSKNLPLPDLIKIDVEGAESEIFKTANNFFENHRPILLVEVANRSFDNISSLLREFKYELYDADSRTERRPATSHTANILGIPSSQIGYR